MSPECSSTRRTFEVVTDLAGVRKGERPGLQPRAFGASKSTCVETHRMSIVNQKPLSGQFRCRYQAGVPVYEQIISSADKPHNYQSVPRLVVESAWAEFYRRPADAGVNHGN
ncbi:hypothetical protein NB724_001362 [Pantoea ananatis]|nr:hypothetical protein [Pantoea ananatis]MCW0334351.1 hypothetical protein [Pantoea ananatis]MCW0382680.1 hypothetical protein [Pantoea ananatis]MCW0407344.1 hypothetical protein [Pantoea ananatis]MCW0427368.1 hypothetical protein [Pantoea ananatis]